MNNEIFISVCIPTYSRLHYLQQAVISALMQSYDNLEICISQDINTRSGANAAIKDWCLMQSQTEEKVRYYLSDRNLGLAGNWNQLLTMAKGDYIIIIGDDDLLAKDYISKMVDLIKITEADVVFSNQLFINAEGNVLTGETERLNKMYKRSDIRSGILANPVETVFNNSVPMSASLIKRNLFSTYRFDEDMNTPEFELFLRSAIAGKKFAYLNEPLACYRIHNSSATSGGLSIDKLLMRIIPIEVPEKFRQLKEDFIASKLIPAINMSLRRGDKKMANGLLTSMYYPEKQQLKKLIQTIFYFLPTRICKNVL